MGIVFPVNYVPVVKNKVNDMRALGRLDSDTRASIKPLIEMSPVPKGRITHEHLYKFGDLISRHYPIGDIFVDLYGLLPGSSVQGGQSAIAYGYELLKRYYGRKFTPVFGVARDESAWSDLREVVNELGSGFCFRVDADLLDYSIEDCWAEILERSASFGLAPEEVDVVVDLRDCSRKEYSEWYELLQDFFGHKPIRNEFRSIIVIGSSALSTVSCVESNSYLDVPRMELRLWASLAFDLQFNFDLSFGDYGVVHPEFVTGGNASNANAKIRYTSGDLIRYYRGVRVFGSEVNFGQYRGLAQKVRGSALYSGTDFSEGDWYIDRCASGSWLPSNLGDFVFADSSHHFTYCAKQMRRLWQDVRSANSSKEVASRLEIS